MPTLRFWETKYILIENKIQNNSSQGKKTKKTRKIESFAHKSDLALSSGFSDACMVLTVCFTRRASSCRCDAGGGSGDLKEPKAGKATPLTLRWRGKPTLSHSASGLITSHYFHFFPTFRGPGGKGGGGLFTEVSHEVSHHHCLSPRLPPLDAPTSRNTSGERGKGVTHPSPRNPPFPTRHCAPGAPDSLNLKMPSIRASAGSRT
uniref:Uncharacterized protein n=1 Tax=Myotis myotis TaxID=51298 RepID=A0A7J7RV98_MYOMY|nr:hypothetical protein mMyoMyo1_010134 [Myotis myotis]